MPTAELLIVPQLGALDIATEFGRIDIAPCEIAVIPRGIKFKVGLKDGPRAAMCARTIVRSSPCRRAGRSAPIVSPIRATSKFGGGLRGEGTACRLTIKWCGGFHVTEIGHSPLDVVAWHGNYAPYKYDLRTFAPVGAILFDHPTLPFSRS